MPFLPSSSGRFKPEAATLSSTLDWREYWRANGTSWHSVFELHCRIVDRLRAHSSLWGSS
jgi:hypothetical protein